MSASSLYDLAQRVVATPCRDDESKHHLLEEIKGFRKQWKNRTETELGGCMDAAVMLMAFIEELDDESATEVLEIVARLVHLTAKSFGDPRDPVTKAPPPRRPPPRFVTPESSCKNTAPDVENDVLLGEVLVKLNHVTVDDVQRALVHQRRSGAKLGQALIEIGAAEPFQIQEALQVQKRMRASGGPRKLQVRTGGTSSKPKDCQLRLVSDTVLGEVLVRLGFIEPERLEEGILVQRATGIRIGEALVQTGAITWEQLERALAQQARDRGAEGAPPCGGSISLDS